jgi:hypothetical protein
MRQASAVAAPDANGATPHIRGMMTIEILAVAIGLASLVALTLISVRGPRDRGERLRGNGGPVVPYGDDSSDGK